MGWGLGARGGQAGASGSSLWVLCSDGVYAPPLPAFSTWMQRGALWASTQARSHLTVSLGGVKLPTPPPCWEAGLERAPSLTDHQDGQTLSLRPTLRDCPSWETKAAPPAGSLGRCSRATSNLSSSRRFLALPWAPITTWPQNLVTVLFCSLKCLATKLLFRFLMWVMCGAQ